MKQNRARNNYKRRGIHPVLKVCLVCLLALLCLVGYFYYQYSKQHLRLKQPFQVNFSTDHHALESMGQNIALVPQEDITTNRTDLTGVTSFIQINLQSKEVTAAKAAEKPLEADGLQKLMVLLLALEQASDRLDESVTLEDSDVRVTAEEPAAGFHAGDVLTLRDLLLSMTVYDGNDAAKAVARHLAGSESKFVQLMNDRAKSLGLSHTTFTNVYGDGKDGQTTTAYDLYLIFEACLKTEGLTSFLSLESAPIPFIRNGQQNGITFYNRVLYLQGQKTVPNGKKMLAAKSGASIEHGQSLLLYWQDDKQQAQLAILLQCDDRDRMYQHADALLK